MSVTVLVCQRKTKIHTQMCLESLLRVYPNIEILVVDGNSEDDSTLYLRYMAIKHPNVKLWERYGRSSHGDTMHEAITKKITTEYVITMDSDVITMKHGLVEGMLSQLHANPKMYATGMLMVVSKSNQACGTPIDANDILRYAHPCTAIYHIPTYKTLHRFFDHGAACCENMIEAAEKGFEIGAFPVDKYTTHLSGSSWVTEHKIIWKDDYDVYLRPFATFIITLPEHIEELQKQTDHDFNVNVKDKNEALRVWVGEAKDVSNRFYGIRFQVNGEYVALLSEHVHQIDSWIVHSLKLAVIEQKEPDELVVSGIQFFKRKFWQSTEALS